jgi:GT2 family glycosyltransferase
VKVAAVMLNWNGLEDSRRCLRSLEASGAGLDVVVVDNGSTDGSGAALRAEFPRARHVSLTVNGGFCAGSNAGAREAERLGAEAIFFVNNDAWVEPGFLAPLAAELEGDVKVAAAGSLVLLDDTRRVWCLGGRLRFRENVTELMGFGRPAEDVPREPFDCDYLPGCALLVKTSCFRQVQGFDEDYFAYMEDVDLGLRLREAGWRLRAVPASVVHHRPSSSSGGGYSRARKYANAVNSVRFLRRHGGAAGWLAFACFDVLGLPLAWAREALRHGGDPGAVAAKAHGLLDGLRGVKVDAGSFARYGRGAAA